MQNINFNCVEITRDSPSIGVTSGNQTYNCRILVQEYITANGNLVRSEQHIDNNGKHYEEMTEFFRGLGGVKYATQISKGMY